jgi:membrane protein DedA with SNARE-associated domain
MRMPWKRFVIFNFLGAALWVTVITLIGYKFGEEWEALIKVMGRVNLVIGLLAAYIGFKLWRRYRARRRKALAPSTTAD